MKDKRKNGKQNPKSSAQYDAAENPRKKRLKPVSKAKYKINRYQLTDDFEEEEDDPLYDYYADDSDDEDDED